MDVAIIGGGMVGLWVAVLAAERGMRALVIEIGPDALDAQEDPSPGLRFAARANLGATRARHHVLTGNSAYWGGGLVRNPEDALGDVVGDAGWAREIAGHYPRIESHFGLPEVRGAREIPGLPLRSIDVPILPGRRRGVWSHVREAIAGNARIRCVTRARVADVQAEDGCVQRLLVHTPEGSLEVRARHVALCMGVIDTNLFVERWLASGMPGACRGLVGRHLHDHWSVPVARLRWKNRTALADYFPARRVHGVILDRRLAFADGYFHFTADFAHLPPYDRVKRFLASRQQGRGRLALSRDALACLGHPALLARAGMHYMTRRALLIPEDAPITLTLDFAAHPAGSNAVSGRDGEGVLDWDIRAQDVRRFREIVEGHRGPLNRFFRDAGVQAEWLVDDDSAERHLREASVDAFHLGGGLQAVTVQGPGPTFPGGRLRGFENVQILGTAAFASAGVANPVLTLFAWADEWLRGIGPRVSVRSEAVSAHVAASG